MISGTWLITEMELWDENHLHLVDEPVITFKKGNTGDIRFGACQGGIDWRTTAIGDNVKVEFTFEGFDDGSQISGRGIARVDDDGVMRGRIWFHLGDDSGFVAKKRRSH